MMVTDETVTVFKNELYKAFQIPSHLFNLEVKSRRPSILDSDEQIEEDIDLRARQEEAQRKFTNSILKAANRINRESRRGSASYIITNSRGVNIIDKIINGEVRLMTRSQFHSL